MHQDAKDILYTEEQLKARVAELGHQISADYKRGIRSSRRGIERCYRFFLQI